MKARNDNVPSVSDALKRKSAEKCKLKIGKDVDLIQQIDYWDVVLRQKNRQVVHSKFVASRKRDVKGMIRKHNARLVVCGNEESEINKECYSPVSNFTVTKLVFRIAFQNNWKMKHCDF